MMRSDGPHDGYSNVGAERALVRDGTHVWANLINVDNFGLERQNKVDLMGCGGIWRVRCPSIDFFKI